MIQRSNGVHILLIPGEVARRSVQDANNEHLLDRDHLGIRDKNGGDIEEWPEDLRVREFPDILSIEEKSCVDPS